MFNKKLDQARIIQLHVREMRKRNPTSQNLIERQISADRMVMEALDRR